MSDSSDAVLVNISDGIATITLNRPDRRNALSREIEKGIETALDEIGEQDARCVVFEGAGDAFCAGGDIDRMHAWLEDPGPLDERIGELERTTNALIARIVEIPLPTIAKIDGAAVGAGANLAIATDLQLASDQAKIGFVFRNVGLSVDAGTSYLLPRIVGENTAKELVFTGKILNADEALELGLVNQVYGAGEFGEESGKVIERIASGPTVALRHAKQLLSEGFNKSLDEALRDEARAQGVVFASDDHREGVEAFLERRDPAFEGH